jgi:ATP-dependent DNA ligase
MGQLDQRTPRGSCLHRGRNGWRLIARKEGSRVRLYSRPGNDLTRRFPLIVETLARLRSRSCIIDGEAVASDEKRLPVFERLRRKRQGGGRNERPLFS